MELKTSRKLVKQVVGTALLLLASLWSSPNSWAACAHLSRSRVNLDRATTLTGLEGLFKGRATMDAAGGSPVMPASTPTRRPQPCTGPSCSGQVPLPLSTSIPTLIPTDLWGLLGQSLEPAAAPSRFGRSPEPLVALPLSTSSIFHPPRPSR